MYKKKELIAMAIYILPTNKDGSHLFRNSYGGGRSSMPFNEGVKLIQKLLRQGTQVKPHPTFRGQAILRDDFSDMEHKFIGPEKVLTALHAAHMSARAKKGYLRQGEIRRILLGEKKVQ